MNNKATGDAELTGGGDGIDMNNRIRLESLIIHEWFFDLELF